jgi:hypothetical protein
MAIPKMNKKKYNRLTKSVDTPNGGSLYLKKFSGAKKSANMSQPKTGSRKPVVKILFNFLFFISFPP